MRALFVPFAAALTVAMSGTPALAATEVGVTAAVNPVAQGTPPVGTARTLSLGDGIVFRERIDTSGDGLVQVLFTDGSTITVGPGASLTIDEYIYDPAAGTGRLAVNFGRGALRFIGGRLSKTGDNVEINTPVGTVGIRGGMADLAIDDARAILALLFGNELTLDDLAGQRHRVFERGYTLELNRLVALAEAVQIRRLLPSDTAFFQQQLAGRPGTSGGAAQQPTDETVEESGIAAVNSALSLVELTPLPPPETVSTTPPAEVESSLVGISDATSDTAREEISEQEPPPDEIVHMRVLTAADPHFTAFNNLIVTEPGARGIVGANPDADPPDDPSADQSIEMIIANGALQGTYNAEPLDLPIPEATGFTPVANIDSALGELSGEVFVGSNADFAFYSLFVGGDRDRPVYAFGGMPTPAEGLIGQDELLSYELLPDPRQQIAMPFIRSESVPHAINATVTPLFVMTPDGVQVGQQGNELETGGSTYLLGGLLIHGQGAQQTSAAVLLAGRVFQDEPGVPRTLTSHRGSYRTASTAPSSALTGTIKSLESDSGAHVFGRDGDNVVLSAGFDEGGDIFIDSPVRRQGLTDQDLVYSTIHVANLTDSVSQSELTRSTRTYQGYAAGMLEIGGTTRLIPYRSQTNSLVLRFDAERDTIGGSFTLSDITDQDAIDHYVINFGFQPESGGISRGTYVDDDRYGARQSVIRDTVVLDSGQVLLTDSPDNRAKTYFFGSELAPQPALFAGAEVTPCECKFLEWGYWGTRVRWQEDSEDGIAPQSDHFHLGTWVAGDVTREIDLPTMGRATYVGHAVGNVARDIGEVRHQYLATGGFDLSWSFADRAGSARIRDFDGLSFSSQDLASATSPKSTDLNRFTGTLSNGEDIHGGLSGSFVRGPLDPAQGVIGDFHLTGDGFAASGIVAGERGQ